MPRILKGFAKPPAETYNFPTSEELTAVQEAELRREHQMEHAHEGDKEQEAQEHHQNPKSPIDYARLQAEVIMEDARKQAEELLERARAEAEEVKNEIYSESRSDGYRDGYAEGMAAANTEGKAMREQQAVRLEVEVQHFLESASRAREAMLAETAGELKELAIAIAEKIVRISLKSSGEVVARMIAGATEKLKRREWIHIYIDECDAKTMVQVTTALTPALSALSDHVKIVPMADDEGGTCLIEMPDEIIDASAPTQISNIRDLLADMPLGDL